MYSTVAFVTSIQPLSSLIHFSGKLVTLFKWNIHFSIFPIPLLSDNYDRSVQPHSSSLISNNKITVCKAQLYTILNKSIHLTGDGYDSVLPQAQGNGLKKNTGK